jgi:hypothetical protein
MADIFTVTLAGGQQVPGPVVTTASGTGAAV